jgi:hypothetical protein
VALVFKDLSPLFSKREDKVKEILGDLTAIYDGEYTKWTGTVAGLHYQPRFAVIACITPNALEKHSRYMSQIGGRFLFYRVPRLSKTQRKEGQDMLWHDDDDRARKAKELRTLVTEHIEEALATTIPIEVSESHRNEINRLASLLAAGRAVIEYSTPDNGRREIEDVQQEEPFRATNQLRTLARSLARIHGRQQVTDHDLELVRRVALSSMPGDGRSSWRCSESIQQPQSSTRPAQPNAATSEPGSSSRS